MRYVFVLVVHGIVTISCSTKFPFAPNGSASIKEVCNAYRVSYMNKFDFKELIKMLRRDA